MERSQVSQWARIDGDADRLYHFIAQLGLGRVDMACGRSVPAALPEVPIEMAPSGMVIPAAERCSRCDRHVRKDAN